MQDLTPASEPHERHRRNRNPFHNTRPLQCSVVRFPISSQRSLRRWLNPHSFPPVSLSRSFFYGTNSDSSRLGRRTTTPTTKPGRRRPITSTRRLGGRTALGPTGGPQPTTYEICSVTP